MLFPWTAQAPPKSPDVWGSPVLETPKEEGSDERRETQRMQRIKGSRRDRKEGKERERKERARKGRARRRGREDERASERGDTQ